MKNLLLSFLIFVISLLSAHAAQIPYSDSIEEELMENADITSENIKKPCNSPIKDELLDPKSYGDSTFRLQAYKNDISDSSIKDELIDENFISYAVNSFILTKEKDDDYFFEKYINPNSVRKIQPKTKYDFTKEQIPIRIKIATQLKNTKGILEGATIPFLSEHEFVINGKKYSKGTTILGRVETISESDKMGVPECIKINNFYIDDDKAGEINLYGSISKIGANRSIWVYPLYQAGNICLYVAGFVFVPIHGGRAKLLTSETFTVFYETQ